MKENHAFERVSRRVTRKHHEEYLMSAERNSRGRGLIARKRAIVRLLPARGLSREKCVAQENNAHLRFPGRDATEDRAARKKSGSRKIPL